METHVERKFNPDMENEMEQKSTGTIIREYASLFWHWAWLLVLISGLAGGYSYYSSSKQTPLYRTSTMVQLKSGSSLTQVDYYSINYYAQQQAETYATIMTTSSTLDEVSALVGYNVNANMISVAPIEGTQLMTITVTDTDPTRAALIANTLVSEFTRQVQSEQAAYYTDSKKIIDDQLAGLDQKIQSITEELAEELAFQGTENEDEVRISQLETTLSYYQSTYFSLSQTSQQISYSELGSKFNIIQKDPAQIPSSPFEPNPLQSGMMGAIVGLFAAAGIVVLIEFLDDSIRDPKEITSKWGIPILGIIASHDLPDNNSLITTKFPRSPISEAFRVIRTNLQFASIDHPLRTILVTSPSPGEGKTTISANLSIVIAQGNQSVVLVDADLRRPKVHKLLQQSNRVGLTDQFIHSQDESVNTIKQSVIEGLKIITSGNLPPNPSEILSSEKMLEILNHLRDQFKTVILDSPPILVVPDAVALAARVDGVLLVLKPTVTKWNELSQAVKQLRQVKANLLGVIINDVKIKKSSMYYRDYYIDKE
jgi:non-specific protein-tyrosine kinase